MKNRSRAGTAVIGGVCLCLGLGYPAYSQTPSPGPTAPKKESIVTTHATGTFEFKLVPQPSDDKTADTTLDRMTFDKQFHGDLEATSKGQMLAFGTGAKGSSGGYVAMERVTGTLHGCSGSFILQHSGTMTRGTQQMTITVVPGSGTGQLVGLTGKMAVIITDGKHSYDFEYTLAETP
jgi:hypothetical protein